MSIVILGIDLGKNSCSVVGLDERGTVVVRRKEFLRWALARARFPKRASKRER